MPELEPNLTEVQNQLDDYIIYGQLSYGFAHDSMDDRTVDDRAIIVAFLEENKCRATEEGRYMIESVLEPKSIKELDMYVPVYRSKIGQTINNEMWRKKGPATIDELKASPRIAGKTFQEIFCHLAEQMAFSRAEEDLFTEEKMAEIIDSLIIDPRYITDAVLESFGLWDYMSVGNGKKHELANLERKAASIPELKENLQKLTPIVLSGDEKGVEYNDYRIFRIGMGPHEGELLVVSTPGNRKIFSRYDLYKGYRRSEHGDEGYYLEVEELSDIKNKISEIRVELEDWGNVMRDPELFQEINAKVNNIADTFSGARNPEKKGISEDLSACRGLLDSLGRLNPTVVLTKTKGSPEKANTRLKEVKGKSSYLKRDMIVFQALANEQELPFKEFCDQVKKEFLKTGAVYPKDMTKEDKEVRLKRLRKWWKTAKKLTIAPQLTFGTKIIEHIDRAGKDLKEGKYESASSEFVKLYLLTKLVEVHNRLQKMCREKTMPKGTANSLDIIKNNLKDHSVAPDTFTPDYNDVYDEFSKLLMELKDSEDFEDMKQKVKDFPFKDLIASL